MNECTSVGPAVLGFLLAFLLGAALLGMFVALDEILRKITENTTGVKWILMRRKFQEYGGWALTIYAFVLLASGAVALVIYLSRQLLEAL